MAVDKRKQHSSGQAVPPSPLSPWCSHTSHLTAASISKGLTTPDQEIGLRTSQWVNERSARPLVHLAHRWVIGSLLLLPLGTGTAPASPEEARKNQRLPQAESNIAPDTKPQPAEPIPPAKVPSGPDDEAPVASLVVAAPIARPSRAPQVPVLSSPGPNLVIAGSIIAVIGLAGVVSGGALLGISNNQYTSTFKSSNDEFDKTVAKSNIMALDSGAVAAAILGTAALGAGGTLLGIGAHKLHHRHGGSDLPGRALSRAVVFPLPTGGALLLAGEF